MKLHEETMRLNDIAEPTIHEQIHLPHWTEAEAVLYRFFDDRGMLLYVGVTGALKTRMQSHSRGRWWDHVDHSRTKLEWHWTREGALRAERAAIQAEKPIWNIRPW
ncbi:GIY-YIG nuclease family protein [Micromonospora sp. WMMD754]|uniref:GIY-YIG nuclease family protein n=1 Tax=Micromonospora sp. WMMD754 TaxID=3404114 RepID=UPI003BF495DB